MPDEETTLTGGEKPKLTIDTVPDDGDEAEEEPTYEQLLALVDKLGWDKEYDPATGMCCGGIDWCNEEDPRCPVYEDSNLYDKMVLATMNGVNRLNRAAATFMLRLGRGFTVRVKPRRVVADGKLRMVAMKPCKKP